MNTEQRIISCISWMMQISPNELHKHTHFKDDLEMDSLDLMMLIVDLESWFKVTLSEKEVDNIETIHDASTSIDKRLFFNGLSQSANGQIIVL